mmetsp:Transcript_18825/g.40753  ORF Transcript_18825/g.40753 Transcript_18825/m.40753 type:complete len:424 (+) Transcript_18825:116-1387(+)
MRYLLQVLVLGIIYLQLCFAITTSATAVSSPMSQITSKGRSSKSPCQRSRRSYPLIATTATPFLAQPNDLDDVAQENEEEGTSLVGMFTSKCISIITSIYGIALLLHGLPTFKAQVHVLTMMRASGARKMERAVQQTRQNFRNAYWAAVRNSPSLYYANRSLRRIDGRIAAAKAILAESRKAKKDGIVTPAEERRLARMKRRYIRRLRGDALRLRKAKSSMGRILDALDLDGTWDILKEFVVTTSTIMSTGHNDSRLGKFVCRYCHFLNLGSLVCEANRRIGFPISRLIWTGELLDSDLDDEDHKGIAITGAIVSYAVSAYLILFQNSLALRLSAALLASAVILRGATTLFIGREGSLEEVEFFMYKPDQRLLGVAMIALAMLGMRFSRMGFNGNLDVHQAFYPLYGIEKAIGKSLHVLETLV